MLGKQLNVKVTEFCNANCSYCGYRKQDFQKRIKSGYKPSVLDVDLFIKNLDLLKQKGFRRLHLTGGEPFLHPMIKELILTAKHQGFTINTGTNGSMLDEDMVQLLHRAKVDYLWLSLDTFPLDKHLDHRGLLSFKKQKISDGIKLLHDYKINFFCQTVISHILPKKNGLPDIEGHIDYYKQKFNIKRFVFSYPMIRPIVVSEDTHLATIGSGEVLFSPIILQEIYKQLVQIKERRSDVQIVNPFLSLWQQISQLNGRLLNFECSAGKHIFYLGSDQITLRPCYYFSNRAVDVIDDKPLKTDASYGNCNKCQDQCFRDPSIAYLAINSPITLLKKVIKNPKLFRYLFNDLWDMTKHGQYRSN